MNNSIFYKKIIQNTGIRGILFFTLLVLTNCVTSKNTQLAEAKIIGVYSQKYKGGLKGTPSGIKYKLLVIAPANQDEFNTEGFWIDNNFAPAKAYNNKIGVNKVKFIKGDTLIIQANYILQNNQYTNQDSVIKIKPSNYNAKVLLLYNLKNQQRFAFFNEIKEIGRIFLV